MTKGAYNFRTSMEKLKPHLPPGSKKSEYGHFQYINTITWFDNLWSNAPGLWSSCALLTVTTVKGYPSFIKGYIHNLTNQQGQCKHYQRDGKAKKTKYVRAKKTMYARNKVHVCQSWWFKLKPEVFFTCGGIRQMACFTHSVMPTISSCLCVC